MRSVVTMSMVIVGAVACGTASIGDLPEGDGTPLPDRSHTAPEAGATTPPDTNVGPTDFTLTVTIAGGGTATFASAPAGLACSGTSCTGKFAAGTTVTITPALAAGTIFGGWTGGCTGAGACAPVMNADVSVTATLETLDGPWSGTYTNDRPANGCNFKNAGNLSATLKTTGTTTSTTANITGLEIRQSGSCSVVGTSTGAAPSSDITIAGNKVTGTWAFAVSGVGGTLPFPFTGTLNGKTLTGSWTCTSCTGSFTLTKP